LCKSMDKFTTLFQPDVTGILFFLPPRHIPMIAL